MASVESSLKHESELEPGKVRLIPSGEFAWTPSSCGANFLSLSIAGGAEVVTAVDLAAGE